MNQPVILCHKCGGSLGNSQAPLFGCHCISGYVRDWQTSIPFEQAAREQLAVSKRRLKLFLSQGRDANDLALVDCNRHIAELEKAGVTP